MPSIVVNVAPLHLAGFRVKKLPRMLVPVFMPSVALSTSPSRRIFRVTVPYTPMSRRVYPVLPFEILAATTCTEVSFISVHFIIFKEVLVGKGVEAVSHGGACVRGCESRIAARPLEPPPQSIDPRAFQQEQYVHDHGREVGRY